MDLFAILIFLAYRCTLIRLMNKELRIDLEWGSINQIMLWM